MAIRAPDGANKYILEWAQFSFENHGVSGNQKYQVIPDFPYVSVTLCTEVLGQQSENDKIMGRTTLSLSFFVEQFVDGICAHCDEGDVNPEKEVEESYFEQALRSSAILSVSVLRLTLSRCGGNSYRYAYSTPISSQPGSIY